MDRREFLTTIGQVVAWSSVVITIAACGEDDPADPGPANRTLPASIGSNHGHSGSITTAQIDAGGTIFLTLTGGGHNHEVELGPALVDQLAQGMPVTVNSGNGGDPPHAHQVTFTP